MFKYEIVDGLIKFFMFDKEIVFQDFEELSDFYSFFEYSKIRGAVIDLEERKKAETVIKTLIQSFEMGATINISEFKNELGRAIVKTKRFTGILGKTSFLIFFNEKKTHLLIPFREIYNTARRLSYILNKIEFEENLNPTKPQNSSGEIIASELKDFLSQSNVSTPAVLTDTESQHNNHQDEFFLDYLETIEKIFEKGIKVYFPDILIESNRVIFQEISQNNLADLDLENDAGILKSILPIIRKSVYTELLKKPISNNILPSISDIEYGQICLLNTVCFLIEPFINTKYKEVKDNQVFINPSVGLIVKDAVYKFFEKYLEGSEKFKNIRNVVSKILNTDILDSVYEVIEQFTRLQNLETGAPTEFAVDKFIFSLKPKIEKF